MCDPEDEDPLVAPILKIREEISAEFDHDPVRYLDFLREQQKRHANLLVSFADDEGENAQDHPAA